jgi:hypothetical protein
LTAAGDLGKPYVMSLKVPMDRIRALRAAFDATMKDPDFLVEAAKQKLPVTPVAGEEAENILKRIYSFPPDLVAKAKKASE